MVAFLTGRAQVDDSSARTTYNLWKAEQRKVIYLHMQLTETERMAFWPVYDDYQQAIEDLEVEYLQIMELQTGYVGELKESDKVMLYDALLENDCVLAKVRRSHYKKMRSALSASRATEFMRLDHALRTLFRLEIQKNTPVLEISESMVSQFNRITSIH
ncbi:hypothetical protein C900_02425 [Fulvivirga imtechensis AK7]|uniref:Uncharacterized protein n=2 Tax=Fulvivirga TaxID=396811 RepID=L8JWM8_9BACT|nr:hypothetical protein C900_02425 [Fulvivirga imtechensis AK7]